MPSIEADHGAVTVLVVDDDRDFRDLVCKDLRARGYEVLTAGDGAEALKRMDGTSVDVVLLDYRLPDGDGIEVLKKLRSMYAGADVVMVTSHGSIPLAVEAMKLGATEYITKPLLPDELAKTLSNIGEKRSLVRQNRHLLNMLNDKWGVEAIRGQSVQMRRIREQIRQLSESTANVLVTGESGTGKELVARALHVTSPKGTGPFIALNAAGIPAGLAESELFGHRKGAFTGADRDKAGLFTAAHGGTLFLDEIAEMPLELQPKLLRAIESLEVRPIGGEDVRKVDVRIIAATNRDLEAEVAAGRFRRDLYYRLNVVHIDIPPLRKRVEDVSEYAEYFLAVKRGDSGIRGFTPAAMHALESYSWPGNVRELENAMERVVALSTDDIVGLDDLPRQVVTIGDNYGTAPAAGVKAEFPLLTLEEIERIAVLRTVAAAGGDKSRAARVLGINRATLYRKLRDYGVSPDRPPGRKRSRGGAKGPGSS
ncbi:MAG: sigma-54-dependent Fis family transcriptional regulator [Planctomycetes bacterium]|nr:sigma-54-dependent Fis family transcriptional regulator [Planctomycetota bacterium]